MHEQVSSVAPVLEEPIEVPLAQPITLVRSRDPYLLGAVAWWGFDIAVLWACFRAFGSAPPVAVVVMAYFIGMVGNTLPLPGGRRIEVATGHLLEQILKLFV